MKELKCKNCGASSFSDHSYGCIKCNYCGTYYNQIGNMKFNSLQSQSSQLASCSGIMLPFNFHCSGSYK